MMRKRALGAWTKPIGWSSLGLFALLVGAGCSTSNNASEDYQVPDSSVSPHPEGGTDASHSTDGAQEASSPDGSQPDGASEASSPDGAPPPACGNGSCQQALGETCSTCPSDCGQCGPVCGDGTCQSSENCGSCPSDCGACPNPCGDGTCNASGGETCSTCPSDCGQCAACGDSQCTASSGETCTSCALDCGSCPASCGDGTCNGNETCSSCQGDCGPCAAVCGDGTCATSESCQSCNDDCGECPPTCGDGTCHETESCVSCAGDCGACPAACGDGTCSASAGESCQSCPSDCGSCPPVLSFGADWSENLIGGPIVQGEKLQLRYDFTRLPNCRSTHNGFAAWAIELYYSFDLSGTAHSVAMTVSTGNPGPDQIAVEPVIDIPADAQNIYLWAHNSDINGCNEWDSDFGNNYIFPVFSVQTLSQAVGWAGTFNFVTSTNSSQTPQGDIDPAYYFSVWGGSEQSSWVQAEVYIAGITDRDYQNAAVQEQVAKVAVTAVTRTDAYQNSSPGGTKVPMPLKFLRRQGNNFLYQWLVGPSMQYYGLADGAYQYRFEFQTPRGTTPWTLGRPSDPAAYRTMVLAQQVRCDLFPYNPPSGICP